MRLRVCVSQGSIFEPKTTLTDEARGAKAAADAGSSWTGMLVKRGGAERRDRREGYRRTVNGGRYNKRRNVCVYR
jgi:hypothetical protein